MAAKKVTILVGNRKNQTGEIMALSSSWVNVKMDSDGVVLAYAKKDVKFN